MRVLPKPVSERWLCHIDVTNVCESKHGCAYCTRYVRHMRSDQLYFMPVEEFKLAVRSLRDWPGMIGIMGGLPTKHPKFSELCAILRDNFSPNKLEVWSSGEKEFFQKRDDIDKTFAHMSYNEHNDTQVDVCQHQVTTMSIGETVDDPEFRDELSSNCWVLDKWCPNISHRPDGKGAFVCELMSGLDFMLESVGLGGKGIDFGKDPDWWKRAVNDPEYSAQLHEYCDWCSMCVPMERQTLRNGKELVSEKFAWLMGRNGSKCFGDQSKTEIITGKKLKREDMKEILEKGWEPHKFRGDLPGGES